MHDKVNTSLTLISGNRLGQHNFMKSKDTQISFQRNSSWNNKLNKTTPSALLSSVSSKQARGNKQKTKKNLVKKIKIETRKIFIYVHMFLCRTVEDLTSKEFLMEVQYMRGKRPFWYGENPKAKGQGEKAFWGWLEDLAEPDLPPTLCYLGETRPKSSSGLKCISVFRSIIVLLVHFVL